MKFKLPVKAVTDKLPNNVSSKLGRTGLVTKKHSPTILFGAGIVGMVATVVLASRATLKMEEVLEEAQGKIEKARNLEHPNYSEKDRQKDLVLVYSGLTIDIVKLYGPAVITGIASVCALTGSHVILNRRNVALTAAYKAVEKGFEEYRRRVVEQYGEDTDRELRYGTVRKEIVEDTEEGPVVKNIMRVDPNTRSGYARFFDQLSPSWEPVPEYNFNFIRCQQNYANDLLRSRGHVFLNEVYDMLGVPRSKAGAVVGWVISKDGDNYVDFGVFDSENAGARDFVNGREGAILLDFNVDGVIYDKI